MGKYELYIYMVDGNFHVMDADDDGREFERIEDAWEQFFEFGKDGRDRIHTDCNGDTFWLLADFIASAKVCRKDRW